MSDTDGDRADLAKIGAALGPGEAPVLLDGIQLADVTEAFKIQRRGDLTHDPRCSSVPGWHPLSGPGLLCDCGAVSAELRRQRQAPPR